MSNRVAYIHILLKLRLTLECFILLIEINLYFEGHDPNFKYVAGGMVCLQLIMLYVMKDVRDWTTILLVAYCFGGVVNHSLSLACHEIAHNLAFGHSRPLANRMFGFFCNLPLGVPMSVSFKVTKINNLNVLNL